MKSYDAIPDKCTLSSPVQSYPFLFAISIVQIIMLFFFRFWGFAFSLHPSSVLDRFGGGVRNNIDRQTVYRQQYGPGEGGGGQGHEAVLVAHEGSQREK